MKEERPSDVTLVDLEASIEHFTRGTVRSLDALLILTEPYYRSLETLGRMAPLARQLGIPHIFAVANKVRSQRDEAALREYAQRHEIEVVGAVPFDENVTEADSVGRAVIDHSPAAPAVRALAELAEEVGTRMGTAEAAGR